MNDGASSPITAETASDPIVFLSDVGQTNGNSAFVTKGGYLAASFSLEANTVITGFDFPIVSLSGPISRIAWSFVDSQLNQVFASGSADVIATSVPASPYLYIYNEYNISANIPATFLAAGKYFLKLNAYDPSFVDKDGDGTVYWVDGPSNGTEFAFQIPNGIGGYQSGISDKGITLDFDLRGHMPCFASGTLILTTRGEVPVERLAVGDRVVTATGAERPIRWIGWREVDIARQPRPELVRPLRIARGAFGEAPRRDLFVSPEHAIRVGEALIPAKCLVNGATIAPVEARCVTYWHVELENHDVLLAEGLPAETYRDCGNRSAFANGGGAVALFPEFEVGATAEPACLPVVADGPQLAAARAQLARQAEALGWTLREIAGGLHAVVDGVRVECVSDGRWASFAVRAGAQTVRLAGPSFVPGHVSPQRGDERRLGVMVYEVAIKDARGRRVTLPLPALAAADGFHPLESSDGGLFRWTDGDAAIRPDLWADLPGPLTFHVKYATKPGALAWTPPPQAAPDLAA